MEPLVVLGDELNALIEILTVHLEAHAITLPWPLVVFVSCCLMMMIVSLFRWCCWQSRAQRHNNKKEDVNTTTTTTTTFQEEEEQQQNIEKIEHRSLSLASLSGVVSPPVANRRSVSVGTPGTTSVDAPIDGVANEGKIKRVPTLLALTRNIAKPETKSPFLRIVNQLHQSLQYRFVTQTSYAGLGLSSIFSRADTLDQIPNEISPRASVIAFGGGSEFDEGGGEKVMVDDDGSEDDSARMTSSFIASTSSSQSVAHLVDALALVDLFAWLPDPILFRIARRAKFVSPKSGQVIFTPGTLNETTSTYVVVSGEVHMTVAPFLFKSSAHDEDGLPASTPLSLEEQRYTCGRGRLLGGVSDFVRCVTGVRADHIATATAAPATSVDTVSATTTTTMETTESCVVAKLTKADFDFVFERYAGVREDILARALVLLQRVTFASVFRLSGRLGFGFPPPHASLSSRSSSLGVGAGGAEMTLNKDVEAVAAELNISPRDLLSFSESDDRPGFASLFPVSLLARGEEIKSNRPCISVVTQGRLEIRTALSNARSAEHTTFQLAARAGQAIGHLSVLTRTYRNWYRTTVRHDPAVNKSASAPAMTTRGGNESFNVSLFESKSSSHSNNNNNNNNNDGGDFGRPNNYIVAMENDTRVIAISDALYFELVDSFPEIIEGKARQTAAALTPVIRLVDHATLFVSHQPGDVIVREDQVVDDLRVVLYGQLRATATRRRRYLGFGQRDSTDEAVVGEYLRGAVIGEFSFLTRQPSVYTIRAVRSSALAVVPHMLLAAVTAKYPSALAHLARTVSNKMSDLVRSSAIAASASLKTSSFGVLDSSSPPSERHTVALIPVSPNVNLDAFAFTLKKTLEGHETSTAVVSSHALRSVAAAPYASGSVANFSSLGLSATATTTTTSNNNEENSSPAVASSSTSNKRRNYGEILTLSRLNDLEDTHDIVLYLADSFLEDLAPTAWSEFCVRQADTVLLLVSSKDEPRESQLDQALAGLNPNARRELVVLHVLEGSNNKVLFTPTRTRDWISLLGRVSMHMHIRVHPNDPEFDLVHFKSDFKRLGRWLTGRSIGLVLAGGGARGGAHVGVFKALEEAQIPVDIVGGTSIGAFCASIYAKVGGNLEAVNGMCSSFAKDSASNWLRFRDLTFPLVSWFKGKTLNRTLVRIFGEDQIEDFWLNCFCVTTDLTDSRRVVIRNGFAWKYTRASMSLAGIVPPVCDLKENKVHYLVDGGYVDNLPVGVMREFVGSRGTVIAVDIQSNHWTIGGDDYGHDLNGLWLFVRSLNPFASKLKIPTWGDIQSHLAYVSCQQQFESAQSEVAVDLLIKPDLGEVATLEFSKWETVRRKGYEAAVKRLREWVIARLASSEDDRHPLRFSTLTKQQEFVEGGELNSGMSTSTLSVEAPPGLLALVTEELQQQPQHAHDLPAKSPITVDLPIPSSTTTRASPSLLSSAISNDFVEAPPELKAKDVPIARIIEEEEEGEE